MNGLVRSGLVAAVASLVGAGVAHAQAGVLSNTATVTLNATKEATLTVTPATTVTSIPSIADGTTTDFDTDISITTEWNLSSAATVHLVGWFATPAAAMSGPANIPSDQLKGRVATGAPTTYTAFTQGGVGGVGVAGGSLTLFSQLVDVGTLQGNRTDVLELQLDRTGQPALPAGAYTGTLNLRAITQ